MRLQQISSREIKQDVHRQERVEYQRKTTGDRYSSIGPHAKCTQRPIRAVQPIYPPNSNFFDDIDCWSEMTPPTKRMTAPLSHANLGFMCTWTYLSHVDFSQKCGRKCLVLVQQTQCWAERHLTSDGPTKSNHKENKSCQAKRAEIKVA